MCWDTDLPTVEVTSRRTVTLAEFRSLGFVLVEREMLTILADES
jgi:hypothetical protein